MNKQQAENAISFAYLIKNKSAYTVADTYLTLVRLSKRLTVIDTNYANGTRYTDELSYDQAIACVYIHLKTLLEPLKMEYYHQTDPRGVALYIAQTGKYTEKLSNMNYSRAGLAIH